MFFYTKWFSKNFSNLLLIVPDVLKIAFSMMGLLYNRIVLYNRITLYNRTITSLVLFIFTGVTFQVFDVIYFCLLLKALDIGRFLWWMCCKTKIQTKVSSLKSSNFIKFYPNPLKLCKYQETKPLHKKVPEISIKMMH